MYPIPCKTMYCKQKHTSLFCFCCCHIEIAEYLLHIFITHCPVEYVIFFYLLLNLCLLVSGQVIKAWDVGVATMTKGEVAVLYCKPEYAYGEKGQGSIPPNATLIFEVELFYWKGKNKKKILYTKQTVKYRSLHLTFA